MLSPSPNNGKPAEPEFWRRRRLIRESRFSAQEKLLLLLLSDYAGDDGRCYAAMPTVAADMSLSTRRVQELIRDLRAAMVLTVHERPGRSNLIAIEWEAVKSAAGVRPAAGVKPTAGEGCGVPRGRGEAHRGGGVKPTAGEG